MCLAMMVGKEAAMVVGFAAAAAGEMRLPEMQFHR